MFNYLGIDVGTSNTTIFVKGAGIKLRQPTVVAVDNVRSKVIAVGREAKQMLGKTPESIGAYLPLRHGVIADFDIAANMLNRFLKMTKRASGNPFFYRPKVMISIPFGVTNVEKRAFEDAALEAGAKSVALITAPLAAAIGADLHIHETRGSMVVDIGGGTTEAAVLTHGGIASSNAVRVGGDDLDAAIVGYIKRKYNVYIGDVTAELLKNNVGSAFPGADVGSMEVRGRNLMTGLPATIAISSEDIRDAMYEQLVRIIDCVHAVLEDTPPELASDIYDRGMVLTGGCAKLKGLDMLIAQQTGVRTFVTKHPQEAVILGIGRVLEAGDFTNYEDNE